MSTIFLLAIIAGFILIGLSFFKPWTKRKKSSFFAPRFHFHPNGKSKTRFPCVLTHETTSWKGPQHSKPELYLSVIVPAMNEEKRLPQMLDECLEFLSRKATLDSQFTYEAAFAYASSYPLHILRLPKNTGKGGAVREGVFCARGQFILFADADGATRFADLEKLEKRMNSLCNGESAPSSEPSDWTHPAMVVGSRAHLEQDSISQRSFLRTVLMVGFHALVWIFTVRTVRDTQCGFKLLSRAAAAKLFPQLHIEKWAFDVELIYLAEQLKYSVAEVAVEWTEIDGSKVTPFFSWIQMGRDILIIWFLYTFHIWEINQIDQD
ncbi:hypothetical protein GPALN_012515 [Globodera pallida]|nr:hypothetical protein GPALN_012515 [Globodera pallida]